MVRNKRKKVGTSLLVEEVLADGVFPKGFLVGSFIGLPPSPKPVRMRKKDFL